MGFVAGGLYLLGDHMLLNFKIDDAVNAVPVHMINGAWGLFSVGLFASPDRMKDAFGTTSHGGFVYSLASTATDNVLLRNQLYGILFLIGWISGTMNPFFVFLKNIGWFRIDVLAETVGLDIKYNADKEDTLMDDAVKPEDLAEYIKVKVKERKEKRELSASRHSSISLSRHGRKNNLDRSGHSNAGTGESGSDSASFGV